MYEQFFNTLHETVKTLCYRDSYDAMDFNEVEREDEINYRKKMNEK